MARILITRSPHQASDLADRLRAAGVEPILIPTIALEDPTTFEPLDSAIAELNTFHWLLFTSANAVEAFHRRLTLRTSDDQVPQGFSLGSHLTKKEEGALALEACLPPTCRIAAIGPATAHAIEKLLNRKPDIIPPQAVAESLAEVLLPHATQKDGSPTRFLLVRAESARDHLSETLRAAGADVTIAPAYRTVIPPDAAEQIKALFADRTLWPDAITFTSSSTVTNLFTLLASAGITLPPEILRASIGPITSQTLRDLGFPPQLEAAEPTVPALVEILVKTLGL